MACVRSPPELPRKSSLCIVANHLEPELFDRLRDELEINRRVISVYLHESCRDDSVPMDVDVRYFGEHEMFEVGA